MTETKEDREIDLGIVRENAELKAQVAQLQSELQSVHNLIRAYEAAADCVRSAAAVLPRLVKREGA